MKRQLFDCFYAAPQFVLTQSVSLSDKWGSSNIVIIRGKQSWGWVRGSTQWRGTPTQPDSQVSQRTLVITIYTENLNIKNNAACALRHFSVSYPSLLSYWLAIWPGDLPAGGDDHYDTPRSTRVLEMTGVYDVPRSSLYSSQGSGLHYTVQTVHTDGRTDIYSRPSLRAANKTKQKQTKQNKNKQNNFLHFFVLFNNAKETKIYLSNFCFEYFPQNQTSWSAPA